MGFDPTCKLKVFWAQIIDSCDPKKSDERYQTCTEVASIDLDIVTSDDCASESHIERCLDNEAKDGA